MTRRGPASGHLHQEAGRVGKVVLGPPDQPSHQVTVVNTMWNGRIFQQGLPNILTHKIKQYNKMVAVLSHQVLGSSSCKYHYNSNEDNLDSVVIWPCVFMHASHLIIMTKTSTTHMLCCFSVPHSTVGAWYLQRWQYRWGPGHLWCYSPGMGDRQWTNTWVSKEVSDSK